MTQIYSSPTQTHQAIQTLTLSSLLTNHTYVFMESMTRPEASGIIPAATIGTGSVAIPLLGLGTATFPFESNVDMVKSPILSAIRLGYRHFDTAAAYQTEVPLGLAVAEALRDCLIGSREELFVTSKLWCSDAHPDLVLPALRNTLKNLQMEYLDLYLIHWPLSYTPGKIEFPFNKDEIQPIDIRGVWKAMEDCQKLGLTKAIGVSNFSCKKLEDLISFAEIPPAVVQVEMNPLWRQNKLRQFCASKGIHLTAYSPLGAKGAPWGSPQVMDNDILKLIAKTREKTIAQVCLRWVFEQGVSVLVKSFNEKRMEENLEVIGWELNEEDLSKINDIPQARAFPGHNFVSDSGPFKSIDDLWDGEV